MTAEEKFRLILKRYLPEKSIEYVFYILKEKEVHLIITKERNTKLGDYRNPFKEKGHRITVNGDINKFEFLFIFLHEMAHMNTWILYKNRVMPHGQEWKEEFVKILREAVNLKFFPEDVENAIIKGFLSKKGFTAKSDDVVKKLLRNYSEKKSTTVEDVPENAIFVLKNGRQFKKLEKIKKRYRCQDVVTGRFYVVHPLAEVVEVHEG
ncbi:MAG: hypothetical protein A2W91_07550 [Bacteroidetes bacterium GWF2_38_335]|nr:MAG: hypothetical protein A2W91_07550 [Bacteroidetes bacterium GWF2_38_335]OFY78579.1 MAG: hypothetical protein A2281_17840 [Bacteroidetes bacterium RIFOXYA12_FULL_38_20]HBS85075.1 sprT domain-containing protein [Bacteroidales bacterium]